MACRFSTAFVIAWAVVGCGRAPNPIDGAVDVAGRPLGEGFVTFFPVDAKGVSLGAVVENGRFSLPDVPPGTRRILVSAPTRVDVDADGKPKIRPTTAISPKTAGNNATVTIVEGMKTLKVSIGGEK